MHKQQLKREVEKLLNLPPVEFEQYADNAKLNDLRELQEELEKLAVAATFIAVYLDNRYGFGCGDQGHKTAAKKANQARTTLRNKVMGYNETHPIPI